MVAAPHPDDVAAVRVAVRQEDDYKALRRSRWRWRALALLAVIGIAAFFGLRGFQPPGPYVARHDVSGIIFDDVKRNALIEQLAEREDAKALILRIDSPGGTTSGSEALYESIRLVAEKKPVVAVMGEVAASGGYIAALGADHIVARGNTITGSIGVIFQAPNAADLLDRVGIDMIEIKSDPLKAAPSPFEPVDPAAIAAQRVLVEDSYDWFVGLVQERRDMSANAARAVGDGRIFTGRLALENGLIDAIGGEREAIAWLEEQGVESDLDLRDVTLPEDDGGLGGRLLGAIGFKGDLLPRVSLSPSLMSILR